jgi:hypothetical protein
VRDLAEAVREGRLAPNVAAAPESTEPDTASASGESAAAEPSPGE